MKIGILGGTFDPIHNAHIMIATKACDEFGLDKILLMPAQIPPHKDSSEISSIDDRIKMIKLAIKGIKKLEFSDFELKRAGYSYSADTLSQYKELHPDDELYFILGSDSLYGIDSWYHPEIIFKSAHILTAKRDDLSRTSFVEKIDYLRERYDARISEIFVDVSSISSTFIRHIENVDEYYDYLPAKVADYIIKHNLYHSGGSRRMTIAEITDDLKKTLEKDRFKHTINVAETAKKMAEALGENPNKAYLAGILHDCAKCMGNEKTIKICKKYGVSITEFEMSNQFLLHAKAGACLTEQKYHIKDSDIINAVRYHTTGRPEMSLLEKIIFTADYIEPGRTKQPNLELLRELAYKDIDKTVLIILRDTLGYLRKKRGDNIDENTVKAYNYYASITDDLT